MTPQAATPHLVICLHPDDSVVIARATLLPGTPSRMASPPRTASPQGTKWPYARSRPGEPVRRYNQIIGFAMEAIAPGQHVHVHNLGMGEFAKDYAYGQNAKPTEFVESLATFEGIRRADGRVATRNYIGILTSVNCSAHVASLVADAFKRHPFHRL